MVERWQRCFHLLQRDVRLNPADYAQKARAAHHSFIREPGNLERLCGPDLRNRVRAEPGCRHVRQHAYNRMRRAIERDAAADHVRIAAEALLPKILRHHGDVSALFFLWQEVASENRTRAEHFKIIRRQPTPEDLHRIADTGQCKQKEILRG